MASKKLRFQVEDEFRNAEPKADRNDVLAVTTSVDKAVAAAEKAKHRARVKIFDESNPEAAPSHALRMDYDPQLVAEAKARAERTGIENPTAGHPWHSLYNAQRDADGQAHEPKKRVPGVRTRIA